jgi:hypothetical protein
VLEGRIAREMVNQCHLLNNKLCATGMPQYNIIDK